MSNVTDTIVLDLPKSAPYYDDLMKLLEQAKADNHLHVIADWDITECDLRAGDIYSSKRARMQVMNVSYIMAEDCHTAAMLRLDDNNNIVSMFNAYADDILNDSSLVRVSRWGENKPKLRVLK